MSLINQVLQDLDRRRASQAALPLADHVSVPLGDRGYRHPHAQAMRAALLIGAVAAAALIWRQTDVFGPTAAAAPLKMAISTPIASQRTVAAPIDPPERATGEPSPLASPLPGEPSVGAVVDGAGTNAALVALARPSPEVADVSLAAAARADDNVRSPPPAPSLPTSSEAALAAPARVEKSTPPLSPGERAEVEYRRGLDLHGLSRGNDAEAAFAAALQQDGGHAPARRALALEWIDRGRLEEAARLLRDGLAQNGQTPQLAIVLARLQAQRDDLQGGISTLRMLLDASVSAPAEQAEARALMATLQQSAGQHREAIDSYTAALRQVPQKGAWWVGLGLSLAAEGRPASAAEAFERARATGTLSPELLVYVEQRLVTPLR